MRKKVLVCAYSCLKDPDERFGDGGEGLLGWNIVYQINRFNDVYVLTHFKNKGVIEKELTVNRFSNLNFYYIKLPFGLELLNKFHGGIQIAAYLWQIKAYFVAKKLHSKFKFDIFHHVTYANDWMVSFIGALLPIPYIRGPGGGAHKIPKAFLANYSFKEKFLEGFRSFGQWFFRHDLFFILGQNRAKAILVCNNEAYDALLERWKEKSDFFPVNGIDEHDINLPLPTRKAEPFKIITAGKLLKLKNFDLAIRSFDLFCKKYPDSLLEIVGQGPEEKKLREIVKELNLNKKVLFLDWQTRENLFKKMLASDVFLFPSLRDGGGAVVVEAMAQGKPIICFDIAGPGFHIQKEWGVKIKPKNPKQSINDMALVLERLYNDKKLRESLGKKAQKRAKEYYDWDVLGDKLKKIYDKIIS